jgi:hypothetical protein
MALKFKWIVFISILFTYTVFGQLYESIEKEAADIMLSLSAGNSVSTDDFTNIKELLDSDIDEYETRKTYSVTAKSLDSLKNHLIQFESELINISADSALVLFNQWYLQFSNTFYEYNKVRFFSSNKTKILLFTASISCHCTLEMCKNQLIDILEFVKENNYEYDHWVVDSYWYNELQIKYETLFAPSVIIFNSNNEVLHKIEYDEKMLTSLKDYFNNNIR